VFPGIPPSGKSDGTDLIWAPILATLLIDNLTAGQNSPAALFDQLHLRTALADHFSALGVDRDSSWRLAARVRILLAHPNINSAAALAGEQLWSDGDFRWLNCLTDSGDATYVNKECFEELLWWLQVPRLLSANSAADYAAIEALVEEAGKALLAAGYELATFRESLAPTAKEPKTASAVVEEELAEVEKDPDETLEPIVEEKAPAHL